MDEVKRLISLNPLWAQMPVSDKAKEWIVSKGEQRNRNGKNRQWKSKTESEEDKFHVSGVAAEWAVARFFGITRLRITGDSRDELNNGDLELGDLKIEVKSGKDNDPTRWDLIENEDKIHLNIDRPYVHCITCFFPKIVLITGWAYGHEILSDGMRRQHRHSRHGIWILPLNKLKPIEELRERIS